MPLNPYNRSVLHPPGKMYWMLASMLAAAGLLFMLVGLSYERKGSAAVEKPTLPWNSGVVVGFPQSITAWENFRGTKVTVAMAYTERDTWHDLETADWVLGYYKTYPGLLVISQPFWPTGTGGSINACASGAYDSHWKKYGAVLKDSGRIDNTYTRLAWEFNGDWMDWSAHNPAQWKACWRKVVLATRSTGPGAKFEWPINAHGSQSSDGDVWKSYPGDDVVDVLGISAYDHWPASTTEAIFNQQCNGNEGLCTLIKYAREHGKKVGVGEWGVAKLPSQGGGGAGDNPFYIQKMYETFYSARDVMGYETYFNDEEYGNAIFDPMLNPKSANKYVELFGANSPVLAVPVDDPEPGDANDDGKVNALDLSVVIVRDGQNYTAADFNKDGVVGAADLSIVLSGWTW